MSYVSTAKMWFFSLSLRRNYLISLAFPGSLTFLKCQVKRFKISVPYFQKIPVLGESWWPIEMWQKERVTVINPTTLSNLLEFGNSPGKPFLRKSSSSAEVSDLRFCLCGCFKTMWCFFFFFVLRWVHLNMFKVKSGLTGWPVEDKVELGQSLTGPFVWSEADPSRSVFFGFPLPLLSPL